MNKAPTWFMVVAVLALAWNLMGCFAMATDLSVSQDDLARLPAAEQALHARPAWGIAGSILAVAGGALGCLGLVLRRRWALPVLVLSLLGIVGQDIDLFVVGDAFRLAGPVVAGLQGLVFVIGIGLVLLARMARDRGWLR